MAIVETRRRNRRMELRTTPAERDLIDRAAAATSTKLTDFVISSAVAEAQRVLAARDQFMLSDEAAEAWQLMNDRPARELPGLRRLMDRPSPFIG